MEYLIKIDHSKSSYIIDKSDPISKTIMKLVDVALEGTNFKVINVKRSPVTKKLLVHIDDKHSNDISLLCPNKVI